MPDVGRHGGGRRYQLQPPRLICSGLRPPDRRPLLVLRGGLLVGVQALDLGGEPRGLAGQLGGELHRRGPDLLTGEAERDLGLARADVQQRRVTGIGDAAHPPVRADVHARPG